MSRRQLLWTAGALASHRGAAANPQQVQLVVPFPAGGSGDAVGRLLSRSLSRLLGKFVYVANVAGATGQRGVAQVARARPDGHTIVLGNSAALAIAPSLFPALPYRPESDFVAVGQVCVTRQLLVVHPTFPAKTLTEAIAVARAASSPMAFGSWGVGSAAHLLGELIRLHASLPLLHVPYQGVAPMLRGLLSQETSFAVSDVASALSLVRAGKLVALAVSGQARHPVLPDVRAMSEEGIPCPPESWFALFAPAPTPLSVLAWLQVALESALREPGMRASMRTMGLEPASLTGMAFVSAWRDDMIRWREVVLATGVTVD